MKKALKSFYRSSLKTIFTFLLLVAAAFLFLYQTTMTNWGTQYIYPSYADVAHLYQVYTNPNL